MFLLRNCTVVLEGLLEHLLETESLDPVNDALIFFQKEARSRGGNNSSKKSAESHRSEKRGHQESFDRDKMMKKIAPLLEQLNHRILGKYLSFIEAIDGQLPTLHDSIDEEGEDETDDDEDEIKGKVNKKEYDDFNFPPAVTQTEMNEIMAREFALLVDDRNKFLNRSHSIRE